ncbi:glycosyltransferase family 4 protein [Superficieibacter sp. 1612_C1]|uniref:glycosyltransferase family 4 protein n=1 Tax=Superficieibacter sp. 1612_C1 TaxID=2780382 RepID=UPI001883504D|nr:glycosyltransferase family 4 protein [Superficieibacter sp. 1612_C1]
MKMIFAHDHYFYHVSGAVYSPGKLPYIAFQRYLEHFSNITVLSRYKDMEEVSPNWVRSDGDNISFVKLKNYSSLKKLILPDTEQKKLEEIVRSSDAIVVRLPSEIGFKIASLAKKLGKPYLVEVVACPWDAMIGYGSTKSLIYAPVLRWRMRNVVRNAWGALYVTAKFLQERYPNHHYTISASNVELDTVDESIIELRTLKILSNKSTYKLGLIGSLDSPHKGYDVAYHALAKLIGKGVKVELHIVGGGEKYKNIPLIESLGLSQNIIFHGIKKSGLDIYNFLDQIDLYIQPSSQEGLPRAVIEAMSRACPVVLSTAGGMPELVSEELLHKPKDFERLARIIHRLKDDKDMQIKLGVANYNKSMEFNRKKLHKLRYDFFGKYKRMLQGNIMD